MLIVRYHYTYKPSLSLRYTPYSTVVRAREVTPGKGIREVESLEEAHSVDGDLTVLKVGERFLVEDKDVLGELLCD